MRWLLPTTNTDASFEENSIRCSWINKLGFKKGVLCSHLLQTKSPKTISEIIFSPAERISLSPVWSNWLQLLSLAGAAGE